MNKFAKKVDANHAKIVKTFKQLGFSVCDLSACGLGVPDLLLAKGKMNYLVEIKSDKGTFTEPQVEFIKAWNADIFVVRSVDEAIKFNEDILFKKYL